MSDESGAKQELDAKLDWLAEQAREPKYQLATGTYAAVSTAFDNHQRGNLRQDMMPIAVMSLAHAARVIEDSEWCKTLIDVDAIYIMFSRNEGCIQSVTSRRELVGMRQEFVNFFNSKYPNPTKTVHEYARVALGEISVDAMFAGSGQGMLSVVLAAMEDDEFAGLNGQGPTPFNALVCCVRKGEEITDFVLMPINVLVSHA